MLNKLNEKNYYKVVALTMSFFVGLVVIGHLIFNQHVNFVADKGPSGYYGKTVKFDLVNLIMVGSLFLLHLFGNFYLVRQANKAKFGTFTKYHKLLYVFNTIMIFSHYVQGALNFDGLAKYLPIGTSQGSVILLLICMLVMLSSKRGFLLNLKVDKKILKPMFPIHGFIFIFAIVLTFGFHPIYYTSGHLLGFLYIYLLMSQFMFINLKIHDNIKGLTFLEMFVGLHALFIVVGVQKSSAGPIFVFGFANVFILTHIYGLFKDKTCKIITSGYVLLSAIFFGYQIFVLNAGGFIVIKTGFIPIIYYLIAGVIVLILKIIANLKNKSRR